ncbi:hypothetical protein LCGC14_0479540 [marine sediment metagenome]|uniref:Uncharacterized protein n=1 Tax=marine sediment metagenome TaxID=412755 RepID=A0A0F9VIG5_9ZZZZ
MNHCQGNECTTTIMPGKTHCKKCCLKAGRKASAKVRSKRKPKNNRSPYHGPDGKVRANMGLARLKERDRQNWLDRKAAEEAARAKGWFAYAIWQGTQR